MTTEAGFDDLEAYLLENATGRDLVNSLLYIDGRQTIISFEANTLDWQAAVDFEEGLSQALQDAASTVDGSFTMELSGRALILAQIGADVAISAVTSTAIVAFHNSVCFDFDSICSNTKFDPSRTTVVLFGFL